MEEIYRVLQGKKQDLKEHVEFFEEQEAGSSDKESFGICFRVKDEGEA